MNSLCLFEGSSAEAGRRKLLSFVIFASDSRTEADPEVAAATDQSYIEGATRSTRSFPASSGCAEDSELASANKMGAAYCT